jgi:hypothetical protein
MPKANWGISSKTVDGYDRESQYKPYDGPLPINGVYRWKVKKAQFIAPTGTKKPQLRAGLELIPRSKDEKKYAGYYIMLFMPVAENTAFRYVPFLDAIGVTGREFEQGTITDEEGNIRKIGRWRNDGTTTVKGELKDETDQDGNTRKTIGWMGPDDGSSKSDAEEDAEEAEDDYDFGDDDADEDETEEDAEDDDTW